MNRMDKFKKLILKMKKKPKLSLKINRNIFFLSLGLALSL